MLQYFAKFWPCNRSKRGNLYGNVWGPCFALSIAANTNLPQTDFRLIDQSVELTEESLTSFTVFEIYKNPARSWDTSKAIYLVKQWYKDLFITDLGLWESPVINSTSNSSLNLRRWPYSMSILTGFLPVGVAIVISALFGIELWPGNEEASIQWGTIQTYLIIHLLLIDKIIISMISSSSKETIELEYVFLVSQCIIYDTYPLKRICCKIMRTIHV